MNIVYVVEDFAENGGVERIVSLKANELSTRYGHSVTIVSVYKDDRPIRYTIDESVGFVALDVAFAARDCGRIGTLFSRVATLAKAAKRLNRTMQSLSPDIIFFTTTLGALLLPFCRSKAKKVYESHLARPFNPFQRLFRLTEACADTVVCLTEGDKREFGRAKRVCVIPNFIDQPEHIATDYSPKRAIAVGRLEHQKGFDVLIDCWQKVAAEHPDWHLDIYGDGSKREELQAQIDRLHLNAYITLCGRTNNIMARYAEYSLHIMSSRYEGQPMTLIEAQACALPAVVFDFKFGATDIVKNGFNGIVVPQNDRQAFADALCTMMNSEAMRSEYGRNALGVGRQFYKANVFALWIKLIDELKKA